LSKAQEEEGIASKSKFCTNR